MDPKLFNVIDSVETLISAMKGTQAESDFAFQMLMVEDAIQNLKNPSPIKGFDAMDRNSGYYWVNQGGTMIPLWLTCILGNMMHYQVEKGAWREIPEEDLGEYLPQPPAPIPVKKAAVNETR